MILRPLTPEQERFLQAARVLAVEQMPYMGSIIFAFRCVDAPGLGTFGCDQYLRLYIDFEAVTGRGLDFAGQALLHEAMHVFAEDHLLLVEVGGDPRSEADAKASNIAADAANNDDLRDAGCSMFADGNRWGHVLPSSLGQPDYQTAHAYYRAVIDRVQASADSGGAGQPGADGATGDRPYSGCGSGAGNAWDGELPAHDDLGGVAPAASPTEVERSVIATAAAIRDRAAKGRGSVPGGLVERAEQRLRPAQVPWQTVLRNLLRGAVRARGAGIFETFNRVNRRRHAGVVLGDLRVLIPATQRPVPRVRVIRDTSGSMSSRDLEAATSEIVGISRQLGVRDDDLIIVDWDAADHGARRFRSAAALEEVRGRGGTDMASAILHAVKARPAPSVVVVLTDGETPWPAARPARVPVVAAIISARRDRHADVPAWIRSVRIDPNLTTGAS